MVRLRPRALILEAPTPAHAQVSALVTPYCSVANARLRPITRRNFPNRFIDFSEWKVEVKCPIKISKCTCAVLEWTLPNILRLLSRFCTNLCSLRFSGLSVNKCNSHSVANTCSAFIDNRYVVLCSTYFMSVMILTISIISLLYKRLIFYSFHRFLFLSLSIDY